MFEKIQEIFHKELIQTFKNKFYILLLLILKVLTFYTSANVSSKTVL